MYFLVNIEKCLRAAFLLNTYGSFLLKNMYYFQYLVFSYQGTFHHYSFRSPQGTSLGKWGSGIIYGVDSFAKDLDFNICLNSTVGRS